jgi:hypothetical protein
MTTGVPTGREFVSAWGGSRVLRKLEHSAGLAHYNSDYMDFLDWTMKKARKLHGGLGGMLPA